MISLSFTIISAVFFTLSVNANILYVKQIAQGSSDGTSWNNAFTNLQDALAIAESGNEIWVAAGTYTPDIGGRNRPGDRRASFQLKDGIEVYGGFAGNESNRNERDWSANSTILSGDLNGDDGPDFSNYDENSYQVVGGANSCVLGGFNITAGNADNLSFSAGAGIGIPGAVEAPLSAPITNNMTIKNCVIAKNSSRTSGGGIRSTNTRNLIIVNCSFLNNFASYGGAISSLKSLDSAVTNCSFINNSAEIFGGGVYISHLDDMTITNSVFIHNTAISSSGGGIYNGSSMKMINCTVTHNSAEGRGGGISTGFRSSSILSNCIVWNNTSKNDAFPNEISNGNQAITKVIYSCVKGGHHGIGNISQDPLFVDPLNGILELSSGSRCIDSGDNSALREDAARDLNGKPRLMDDPNTDDSGIGAPPIVDMGAYEFKSEVNNSPHGPVEIVLDRDSYTWTDKVLITITAPDFNTRPDAVDTIGGNDANPLVIETRGATLSQYTLKETGPDTGIFIGEVILTGFAHDADGDRSTGDANGFETIPRTEPRIRGGPANGLLESDDDDNIVVSFQFASGRVATESGPIRWNIGKTEWLGASFSLGDAGTVRVLDPDMNLNPEMPDSFRVRVYSDTDLAGITVLVQETGLATGVFETDVKFTGIGFSDGNTLRVTPADTVTAVYFENTLPHPFIIADEQLVEATSVITGPVPSPVGTGISLDKEIYTWTGKVKITIEAPEHNLSNSKVETIGSSVSNRVKITTNRNTLDHYLLVETGPDTGIFAGEVTLTGFPDDADGDTTTGDDFGFDLIPKMGPILGGGPSNGMLETRRIDGITVFFQKNGSKATVASAPIQWNIGKVEWLSPEYNPKSIGGVRVIDPDMNSSPRLFDRFEVDVWSDSDAGGIDLIVVETDLASGVFEGLVIFTQSDKSSGHHLRVTDGDTVTAEYEDNTLPLPYTIADELDITESVRLDSSVAPLPSPLPSPRPSPQKGSVRLDRFIYPIPFGSSNDFSPTSDTLPNDRSLFPIHQTGINSSEGLSLDDQLPRGDVVVHIEIHDSDFNRLPTSVDQIAQNLTPLEAGPVKISILRGPGAIVLGYAGGPAANNGRIDVLDDSPSLARQLGPIMETAPNSGVFAFDLSIAYTDGPAGGLQCPETIRFDDLTGNGTHDELSRFDEISGNHNNYCIFEGDQLLVEYTDPTPELANRDDGSQSAIFNLQSGSLTTDKGVYLIGRDIILTLTDPDLNLDNKVVESYDLDLVEWDSDAATITIGDAAGQIDAFNPRPAQFLEMEDRPGVFQTTIKMPEILDSDRLERDEKIILEYTDWGSSGATYVGVSHLAADSHSDARSTIYTSKIGAAVFLDKPEYSWTDKVSITVVAPELNVNAGMVDSIGGTDLNPVSISTRNFRLDKYKLIETGKDSGIFTGEVILTGFLHDADGDSTTGDESGIDTSPQTGPASGGGPNNGRIQSSHDDIITVTFEYIPAKTIVASALIRWNLGQLHWTEGRFIPGGKGVVRVYDPDMNLDPDGIDKFEIGVRSPAGITIDIQVVETGLRTGIFTGIVHFPVDEESQVNDFFSVYGRLVASYIENTLPDPFSSDDALAIQDRALINSTIPPPGSVLLSNTRVVDISGNPLDTVVVGQQIVISTDITNTQDLEHAYTYLVQIKDKNDVVVFLGWVTGDLGPGQTFAGPTLGWIPEIPGIFEATIFVWESIDNAIPVFKTQSALMITVDSENAISNVVDKAFDRAFSSAQNIGKIGAHGTDFISTTGSDLIVSTDKASYCLAETIMVKGNLGGDFDPEIPITARIFSSGNLIQIDQFFPSDSGAFSRNFHTGEVWRFEGEHQLILTHDNVLLVESFEFRIDACLPGLVGHWKLDENSWKGSKGEVIDSSGSNGKPGISQNGAQILEEGKVNRAGNFDGDDDYVDLGMIEAGHPLQLSSGGTLMGWFNQRSGDRYQRIIDKSTSGMGTNGYALIADPVQKAIWIDVSGANYRSEVGGYEFNQWTHVAAIITGNAFEIYINGAKVNGSFISGSAKLPADVATNMRIGTWNHSTGREFNGFLDDLRIYNRALSTTEIDKIYGEGSLNDRVVVDESGSNNNNNLKVKSARSRIFPLDSQTLYEDAEDGTSGGWFAYGNGNVLNVEDTSGNRIISTQAERVGAPFRLGLPDHNDWNNTQEFTASFSVLMEEEAAVYFRVGTKEGEKFLCYRSGEESMEISQNVICFGLGISADGQWHSILRNLEADLEKGLPGTQLLSVKDFYVYGSAKLDNIMLLQGTRK